jgi:mono/diheme cytochrome c family protein
MKRTSKLAALAGSALLLAPLVAAAQQPVDIGKREYDSHCAVCHGAKGKGDGPYMRFMAYPAKGLSDLTLISRRNGGAFPFQKVYEYIDGTQELDVHGPRDMPIWGKAYVQEARDAYRDHEGPYSSAAYTRARVLALTDYLNRIQVK